MVEHPTTDNEEDLLRSVAIQNAQSILLARQKAEQDLLAAKEALETRTKELERAHELIRTIADNAASCLLMLDAGGVVTYMNPAAIEETGYTLEEIARAPFHDVLHAPAYGQTHGPNPCPIRRAQELMQPLKNHRDRFARKDGSVFPVLCSLSPLQRDGRPAGAVLEFRDITDEQAVQKALEEANRRKDQFLATLSHELRTPMTAVLGWARMLKLGLSETEAREAIEAIEKSSEIQAQLIDDVLDVSRIVAGKMTFHPSPVDIGSVVQAAITTVHPAVMAKGIEILVSVPPMLPRVLGDEGRLQQIIWNLLSNAVKFTPRGGTITLRVVHTDSNLRLTVQDTGKGIEAAYLPHVFEPFSQEDGTMTRAHEGIGLGLSIVRSLVELHGGRIRAASEGPGRGATFTVELPVIESAVHLVPSVTKKGPSLSPLSSSDQLPNLAGLSVLVVDDQEVTRDLVSAIFRRSNAEVRSAGSVREGLRYLNAVAPDVIVCDIAMPEEDGYAFIREVRAVPATKNIPVIALTAFGRPEDRRTALDSGFDAYLKKPVDPQNLATTAQRLAAPRS